MRREVFFCSCGSNEHFFILAKFCDDDHVYLSVHLSPVRFFRRLINAVKYVFGHRSKYGDFSEICLDKTLQLRIKNFLEDKNVAA